MGRIGTVIVCSTRQPQGTDFPSADYQQLTYAGGEQSEDNDDDSKMAPGLKGHINSVLGGAVGLAARQLLLG
jgi:hypothetical protein